MKLFFMLVFKEFYHLLRKREMRKFLCLVLKYSGKKRFKQKLVKFNKTKIIVPDTLSFIWQYYDIFAQENYRFNTQTKNPVIIDVGSNLGLSCIYFHHKYPNSKIIGIEADPMIAEILIKNLKNNSIYNASVINAAAWIHNDGINLSPDGADGASIIENGKSIKVPSIRLKEILENEERIDFLKMDIEGAETEVLLDCISVLYKIENIFIEYHSFIGHQQTLSQILQLLEQAGFRYHLVSVNSRVEPFINQKAKNNSSLDLQVNIYGYR